MEKKSNIVQVGILGVLIVIAFLLGALLEKDRGKTTKTTDTTTVDTTQPPTAPKIGLDQIKGAFDKAVIKFGDGKGKLVIVEVSDPSCPYCQIAGGKNKDLNTGQFKLVADGGAYLAPVPEFKKLVDQGKASFALLYSPGHGNGEMGMKALYCAFEKGKFWEANDLIMSSAGYTLMNDTVKNDKTQSGAIANFLSSAVDTSSMKTCLDGGKYDGQLVKDATLATSIGVSGTPGFFINDTNFAGAYSFKDMESAVNAALGN